MRSRIAINFLMRLLFINDTSIAGGFPLFHDFFSRDASLDFAREVADNCDPLAFAGGTEAPTASPPPAWRRPLVGDSTGDTTFNVHIGPSGGPRGYTAITGQPR